MADLGNARALLQAFKGDSYISGVGVLSQLGEITSKLGKRAVLVRDVFPGANDFVKTIKESLTGAGVQIIAEMEGARPNAPREDLGRITESLRPLNPDVVVSFGGGSTIDATKAAIVLCTLGGGVDGYFGTGTVTQALANTGKRLTPHVAIQTAASSGAHLTKYSNITDLDTGQKKLIVDEAIVPVRSMFDYGVTFGAPVSLTADGALDGVSHCLEVLLGAVGKPYYGKMHEVACEGIQLVVEYLPRVIKNPKDETAREALGLATDLGGYAIMLGGTNGAHLTSFSLIDILSHGRACAMLNPYYVVFFAPAVQEALRMVGGLYGQVGYAGAQFDQVTGRELGVAVAEAMIEFERRIGFPTKLNDVPGFGPAHIQRALSAAKDPQLKMKLENMPVPLTAEMVDEYMGSVLAAAAEGDLSLIKNL